ncbi:hypothetical protein CERSUDRAFT_84928 [Gelatoporia subvermispora B]|uniref:Uncharacterized protein n=1 Tax=Ceriporiopsis subvermispora (strain B) TaxID=914234 RepID=M2RAM9_CERS8|nr:hypothetical protein CERSUDRAFT_84928 [Gelatoporia subvermispora B]
MTPFPGISEKPGGSSRGGVATARTEKRDSATTGEGAFGFIRIAQNADKDAGSVED